MLIFTPLVVYYFYSNYKSKLSIYLLLATISWCGVFYATSNSVYHLLPSSLKIVVNLITIQLCIQFFLPIFVL